MQLKKANPINFDRKDYNPVACPNCTALSFRVFEVNPKQSDHKHLHYSCVACDMAFCAEEG